MLAQSQVSEESDSEYDKVRILRVSLKDLITLYNYMHNRGLVDDPNIYDGVSSMAAKSHALGRDDAS